MKKIALLTFVMLFAFCSLAIAGTGKIPKIETTDTETQQGYTFGLNSAAGGGDIIADLIATYGPDAKVVDVMNNVLAMLGAKYDEATINKELDKVSKEIAQLEADKAALLAEKSELNTKKSDAQAVLIGLDPNSPDYSKDKANLEKLIQDYQASINAKQDLINSKDNRLSILNIDKNDLTDLKANGGVDNVNPEFQKFLTEFMAQMKVNSLSGEVATSTIGEFASIGKSGVLTINDADLSTVGSNWGNTFNGAQYPGRYKFRYAQDQNQLVDCGVVPTENRNYSYQAEGGYPINVNVQVSTHYKGFAYAYISPIVLDLDGNRVLDASGGKWLPHDGFVKDAKTTMFDITGDGFDELVEWIGPNDGILLVPDKNGDVSGKNFFGNLDGYNDGFEKLSILDVNKDGVLKGDELKDLKVWIDSNGDGKATSKEIKNLSSLGITELSVKQENYVSSFVQNGQRKYSWDWWPSYMDVQKTATVEIKK